MKNAVNELSSMLVSHMAYFDTQFGHYGFFVRLQSWTDYGHTGHTSA
jgi:hypothetical protein